MIARCTLYDGFDPTDGETQETRWIKRRDAECGQTNGVMAPVLKVSSPMLLVNTHLSFGDSDDVLSTYGGKM